MTTSSDRNTSGLRRAGRALEQNTAEFLKDERRVLAQPVEVNHFAEEVDRLRDDVERAAKRVDLLTSLMSARD